ncbi:hypothetical protein MCOR25_008507 [Pyricularia grisea]|nr:hypothetical protein MCOR25_008507 [Pyricularia grisea]
MAIVVPCMDEDISTIEGVLSGIPHESLVILVSNSSLVKKAYNDEVNALHRFIHMSHRSAIAVHQQDPMLATAFLAAGMPELVDPATRRIRNGKGEAMLVGAALAAATGRRYVGFIDADNFVPGSVREYCEAFAAGLHLARVGRPAGKAMVRLSWGSKPKVRNGKLEFSKEGRSSRVTNRWLNRLMSEVGGVKDSDMIATGNAGEHAMSIELATKMRFAGGFAVEPFQYLDLLERFGSSSHEADASKRHDAARERCDMIEVLQIETRNPHLHQDKGDEHIKNMWAQALGAIYRSPVTPPLMRQQIVSFVAEKGVTMPGPDETRVYPPIENLDLLQLWELLEEASTFKVFGDLMGVDFVGAESTLGVVTLLEGVKECISGITRDLLMKTRDECLVGRRLVVLSIIITHHQDTMFAVVFETRPPPSQFDTYLTIAKSLRPELANMDGFIENIRYKSLTRPGWILSLSFWRDEKSLVRWRTTAKHHMAQEKGRDGVLEDYHLRVGQFTASVRSNEVKKVETIDKRERDDVTVVGAAKTVQLVRFHMDQGADIGAASDKLGLNPEELPRGLLGWDIMEAVLTPGDMIFLASWEAGSSSICIPEADSDEVQILRDYGKHDRREAPQYYAPAS